MAAAFLGESMDQRPVSDRKTPEPRQQPLSLEAHLAELKAKYGAPRAADDVPRSSPYHPITRGYTTLQEQEADTGFTAAHPNGLTEREVDLARARLAAAFTGEHLLVTR